MASRELEYMLKRREIKSLLVTTNVWGCQQTDLEEHAEIAEFLFSFSREVAGGCADADVR
jgi:hypothetical protein